MTEESVRPPHEQQAIHQRILRAWFKVPEQRLAQLIFNATRGTDIFYMRDARLAQLIEQYVAKNESPNAHNPDPERRKATLEAWDAAARRLKECPKSGKS